MMKENIQRAKTYIFKNALHYMLLGKYKLKQWDTATHLIEWSESTILTPNDGEDVEEKELPFMASANVKSYSHWNIVGVFLQN